MDFIQYLNKIDKNKNDSIHKSESKEIRCEKNPDIHIVKSTCLKLTYGLFVRIVVLL